MFSLYPIRIRLFKPSVAVLAIRTIPSFAGAPGDIAESYGCHANPFRAWPQSLPALTFNPDQRVPVL